MLNPLKMTNKYKQPLKYLFFGIIVTSINWLVFSRLVLTSLSIFISNVLSWAIAVIVAFFCNKIWVFKSESWNVKNVLKEFLNFVFLRIFTGIFEIITVPIIVLLGFDLIFISITGMDAKILVSGIIIVGNYLISKYWVFKKTNKGKLVKK